MFHSALDLNHLCTVKRTHSGTYLEQLPPNAPWFARFKRRFRSWTLISRDHPKCVEYFKSAVGIRRERKRHALSPHVYIIHPFSKFRIYYEMYMTVVYLVAIFTRCMDYTIMERQTVLNIVYELNCFLCIADMIITFFTGYAHKNAREIVLEPKRIALRYFKSTFLLIDFISFAPVKLLCIGMDDELQLRYFILIHYVRTLVMARLHTVNTYVSHTAEYYGFKTNKCFTIFRHICTLIIIAHCFNSLHFSTPKLKMIGGEDIDLLSWVRELRLISHSNKRYFITLLQTSGMILGCSDGLIDPNIWYEMSLQIVTYVFGKFYTIYLTVLMLHMMMSSRNLEIKYDEVIGQLEEYMTHKDLPPGMRKRLRLYYDYKYQKKFFKERLIGGILSGNLNRDIKIHVCRKLVNNVKLFTGLSTQTVSDILEYLKSEVYLPNDIIIKAGDPGDCMYLLSSGTVAVYTPSGKELCHLQDGAYFGEISLIMKDQLRTANVYAVEICEVYSLERRYFKRYIMSNVALYQTLYQKAEDRMEMLTVFEENAKKK